MTFERVDVLACIQLGLDRVRHSAPTEAWWLLNTTDRLTADVIDAGDGQVDLPINPLPWSLRRWRE